MTPEEILAELSVERDTIPAEALASADIHRQALVEPLIQCIERCLGDPQEPPPVDETLFGYALLLLAKWREARAYPLFIPWLSLPGEGAFDIGGDMVTQDGSRLLAAVCGEDLGPIKALILNREANEYCRSQAVLALALLAARGDTPRQPVVDFFLWLAREGLERECSHVWDSLASASADIEATPAFPELRRAYEEGLADPWFMHPSELDKVEANPGPALRRFLELNPPISDVAKEISWWACFSEARRARSQKPSERGSVVYDPVREAQRGANEPFPVPKPYKAPPKIGRNEPCPCGSGKKYKKCCGR